MTRLLRLSTILTLAGAARIFAAPGAAPAEDPNAQVSFFKHIRPIFQANCTGCHQPAKAKGAYLMTDFARMLEGGDDAKETGKKAIVPGQPDASLLVAQITPKDGSAEMPPKKAPLAEKDIARIRKWIAEGAKNDTPENARQKIDATHPPVYQRAPVIASLDFSPDGALLAVAGFHEVLLWKSDGSELVARLIGLGERVQAVRFSPDGKQLATAGGQPAEFGEVQVWDVEKRALLVSTMSGGDTVYGVSWSPDGKLVAFGCPDNNVRAIAAATGEQVLQQGSHNDWVLDTVFSRDGAHLISVGRDMSTKLTEVETQRFIDNLTSITPGALRGGLQSVALRPGRDEVVIGGADGVPALYQIFRQTKRRIGDNANLLRKFPAMEGRIFAVDYSRDGKLIAAASSYNGRGAVHLFPGEFDTKIPELLLKAYADKIATSYSKEEKAEIERFTTDGAKRLAETKFPCGVYALAFHPDGTRLAAAGEDGRIRLINTANGTIISEFLPVTVTPKKVAQASSR